jgi:hypothetical protein
LTDRSRHDAKSVARILGLSVHTINERLREARRKMAVSSSREAARLLLDAEGGLAFPNPDLIGDVAIGEDEARPPSESGSGADQGRLVIRPPLVDHHRRSVMTLAIGLLALAALPSAGSSPSPA